MKKLVIFLCALLPRFAGAASATTYLPLNLSPDLERRVERLLILANHPVMMRPIPVNAILDALPAGCAIDAVLCRQVREGIAPWLGRAALGHASIEVALDAGDGQLPLPNQRGMQINDNVFGAVSAYARIGDSLVLNAGAVGYLNNAKLTGTFVSWGGGRAQFDIGYRDHWWSPMRDSSMLLSTEAQTFPSVTLSNSVPLTRARLRYEIFGGYLSRSTRILKPDASGYSTGHPYIAGFHASIEPVSGWTIGGSRLMQFGGGDRKVSFRQLGKLLYDSAGNEDVGAPTEFGNQQVSLTSELVIPGRMPMAVYVEYAAEDTFHSQNYRFGNGALAAGVYFPRLTASTQLRYEFSNWEDVWYVHHIYGDAMRNVGHVLGNWGADWRRSGDYVGAQSHMLALDRELDGDVSVGARYRTLQNDSYTGGDYRRMHELTVSLARPWRQFRVSTSLQGGRDVYGEWYGRLAANLVMTGDARNSPVLVEPLKTDTDRATADQPAVERFVDVGAMQGRLRYEEDLGFLPRRTTTESGAHLGLGVRKAVSKHSDFGARVELDDLRGRPLMSLRALDYRFRFNSDWAATGFFGFSRYAARTPAHGYYAGVGLQRRDVLPGWDVGLDLRYVDRIVRKKITPGETIITWPNEYWSMTGASLYLSRRF